MFEAQPSKCTLTSSYGVCHRNPLAGRAVAWACTDRVSGCWTVDAISTWIRHTHTELLMFRTLNEGLKGFKANLMYKNHTHKLFPRTVRGAAPAHLLRGCQRWRMAALPRSERVLRERFMIGIKLRFNRPKCLFPLVFVISK